MNPTNLDDRLRDVVAHMADHAPEPMPFTDIVSHRMSPERSAERPHHRGLIAAGVALALVLAMVTAAIALRPGSAARKPVSPNGIRTIHEVVDYSQTVDMTCPEHPTAEAGTLHLRIDSWGSDELGAYRTRVTYPDGATRDRIVEVRNDNVIRTLTRGVQGGRGDALCAHQGVIEPAQTGVFSLNPLGKPPLPLGAGPQAAPATRGAIDDGDGRDSRHREARRWIQPTSVTEIPGGPGITSADGYVWFVHPKSGETLEQKYRETIAGSGAVSSDAILVERTVKSLPSSTFSSTGYTATLGFDVGQQLPTAKTTPIPAPISTGTNWIWPEVPRVETPIQTAKRFARVALGWNAPTVDANAGPAGPTFVTIVQSGHSPLRVLVIPGAGGTQSLQQIGDGVGTTSTGLALAFATYPEATSADIVSRPDGSLRAWRSTAPVPGQNAQAGSNAKAGGSVLILFRDGAGNVVGANGEVIGG